MRNLIFLLAGVLASAQTPDKWSPELAMKYQTVGAVTPSPDGQWVVWTQTQAILETERSETRTHIWLAKADGSQRVQLTRGEKSCSNPAWSPDGKWIYFTSARGASPDAKANIFRISAAAGEAEQLTKQKDGVLRFEVSPDGKSIAWSAANSAEAHEKEKKEKRDFRIVGTNEDNAILFVAPAVPGPGAPLALTKNDRHITGFSWSPDGVKIAFASWASPVVNDWRKAKVAEVPAAGGAVAELSFADSFSATPLYSPDGKYLAFSQRSSRVPYPGTSRIALLDRTTGNVRQLAVTPDELPTLIGWMPDSRRLLVSESLHTRTALYELPIDGPARQTFTVDAGILLAAKANRSGTLLGLAHEQSDLPPEAYVLAPGGGKLTVVSAANADVPRPPLGRTEVMRWKSKDGKEVEGLLTYPVGYQPGQRVPLILNVHGGPAGVFSEQFLGRGGIYPLAAFSSRGFAILRPNPRGSSGYGDGFRTANFADWGGGDYQDVISGVDALIAKGIVDGNRMAVMGWSYGGYMTSWTITQTPRFKAAVVGAAVTNLWSFTGTTDIMDFIPDYFGGEYWDRFEQFVKHSPLAHAKNVTTPTLVLHGEADLRVPISQGYEFYNAVKRRGTPAEMVVYPRMVHGPEEPKFVLDLMQRHLDWVDRYVR